MNSTQFIHWCNETDSNSSHRKPLIMGVLNVTPNSFSDGGHFLHLENAYRRARQMVEEGVDIIDIGGAASNPGSLAISVDEELSRVIPMIKAIRDDSDVCISIDTFQAQVMAESVAAGASMINDIMALKGENSLTVAKQLDVPICLMHMKGTPRTMQDNPVYQQDVVDDINQFFSERIEACISAGIPKTNLIIDPGIGFGKLIEHNLSILSRLSQFQRHQIPLLLGVSRKRMIGEILNKPVSDRMVGGLTIAIYAIMHGVSIIRTHDVDETSQAFRMIHAIDYFKEGKSK